MVKKHLGLLALACIISVLASCDLLTATPFPGFIDKTDTSVDLGSRVDSIAGTSYDLTVVTDTWGSPRVLLLVEPPSSDSSGAFNYTGQLVFMDQDLNVLGQASTASSADYFSKPYTYTHNGNNILVGYTRLSANGGQPVPLTPTLTATGLAGYAFRTGNAPTDSTVLFATPPGLYTSFQLSWLEYTDTIYGITQGTLNIIPSASQPSPSDPNYSNLGYQLVDLAYDGTNIVFVLSQPSVGQIVAARLDFASAISGGTILPATVNSWPVSIGADRPAVYADTEGMFLVRRDGWMERYTWTQTGALSLTGSTRIVGDKSLTRKYAFLAQQASSGPSYMYRFDPSSRILTRYRRWW